MRIPVGTLPCTGVQSCSHRHCRDSRSQILESPCTHIWVPMRAALQTHSACQHRGLWENTTARHGQRTTFRGDARTSTEGQFTAKLQGSWSRNVRLGTGGKCRHRSPALYSSSAQEGQWQCDGCAHPHASIHGMLWTVPRSWPIFGACRPHKQRTATAREHDT